MKPYALHLLRHGAPETPGLLLGRTDMAPTADGIAACAAQAKGLAIETLISSDLARCHAAATAIGEAAGLPVTTDPRWRELDFGDWDGQPGSAIDAEALGRFWSDPDANPPPGGEPWSALAARVAAALADLAPCATLVVTHGGTIRAALHRLCGFDQRQLWSFDLPYGVLVSLQVWPDSAQLVAIRP
ncbi:MULTISPECIES: histidine phosphatase family protein [unclassified Sphingopyxis]|uniref:histidine phosphatase family protein n=1 Tax=unclassified Sphingopyxis TaxID=2614943 RepID=UPI000736FF32|nr:MULTISPECIES: histidine phosphatase family protein [unclassified Sphingopyxis]KTE39271.1 histidine phosphatase family protein [Sphingopyxis sp. HIX]KTE86136.1 histidine phosphatase family protein [Sphingopyxis sp. HXXIV]